MKIGSRVTVAKHDSEFLGKTGKILSIKKYGNTRNPNVAVVEIAGAPKVVEFCFKHLNPL